MKINLELNDIHTEEPCIICGSWFILDAVEAVAYIEDIRWGSVCESCLSLEEQAKKDKLKAYAKKVKEQAEYTLDWAN